MDLSQLSFFKRFSPELREALLKVGEVKTFKPKHKIFQVGDNDTDFYMLVQGRIRIFKLSKGGQKRILRTVQPGDTFAMVSMFDEQPMFITAEVVGEKAQVFVVERADFFELIQKYYELARFVIDGLVQRLRKYGEAYTSMTVHSVEQRFISYLLTISEQQKSSTVRLPESLVSIAEQLGTVREVLSREIAKLQKRKWLEKKRNFVEIKNKKALEKRLEEKE
ncbi:MAG: Crp/Fnr family transcriptional regulator [Candidatus Altimarinota bacterium]